MPDSYTNLANIVNFVNENKTNVNAKIYWHMTWAYQNGLDRYGYRLSYDLGRYIAAMTWFNFITGISLGSRGLQ